VTSALRTLIWALLLGIGVCIPAWADVFTLGQFTLSTTAANHWTLAARVPADFTPRRDPVWPALCHEVGRSQQVAGREKILSFDLSCEGRAAETDAIVVPWSLDGARYELRTSGRGATNMSSSVLNARGEIRLPLAAIATGTESAWSLARRFVGLGVTHILTGWDHLCFLLCLCMLVAFRRLLILVTAFTIGHSISLSLAFFNVIDIPEPPIEALIALSIALLAREALVRDREQSATTRHGQDRWWHYAFTVTGFGLVHGLGFASALTEIGVSPVQRVVGLASFNTGVEAGQLCFVGVVLLLLAGARRIRMERILRSASLAAAGTIGCFWVIERVLDFAPSSLRGL
jgi:hydrogenase/urease accessory protein HupE